MNEDLDKKLKQAQEDHKRMQSNYEIGKVSIFLFSLHVWWTCADFQDCKLQLRELRRMLFIFLHLFVCLNGNLKR